MPNTSNFNPIFFEKTKDGERAYDIPSRLIKDRVIYLNCEIDDDVASNIVSLMFLLDREDHEEKIDLWITSPGGAVGGLLSIYDTMQRIKAPVHTTGIGGVSSAAAILLAAGEPGHRYALPNSRIMIHQIQIDGLGGSNAEIEAETKELKRIQDNLTEILARHTKHTKTKIRKDTVIDRYLSAEAALDYGIIDHIKIPSKKLPELLKREISSVKRKEKKEVVDEG